MRNPLTALADRFCRHCERQNLRRSLGVTDDQWTETSRHPGHIRDGYLTLRSVGVDHHPALATAVRAVGLAERSGGSYRETVETVAELVARGVLTPEGLT